MQITKLFSCFLLVSLPLVSLSQGDARVYIDSLKNAVSSGAQDTSTAIAMYRLCWELRKSDPAAAEKYGKRALELSTELGFNKGIGSSYNNLGGVYENNGDDWKALQYYLKALEIKKKGKDQRSVASTLNNIAIIYKKQEDFDKAVSYFREALRINISSGNQYFELINYKNLTNTYRLMKRFDSSYYFLNKGFDLAAKLKKDDYLYDLMLSRGNYYLDIKKYQRAIECYDTAYRFAITHRQDPGYLYGNKGNAFLGLHLVDSAGYYLLKGWDNLKNSNDWKAKNDLTAGLHNYFLAEYNRTGRRSDLDSSIYFIYLCYATRDSMISYQKSKSLSDLFTKSIISQKDEELNAILQQKELSDLRATSEHQFVVMLIIIVLLIIAMLLFIWNRFRKTRILSRQLAAKNLEITDSMRYAQRIQQSLLPSEKYMDRVLKRTEEKEK